ALFRSQPRSPPGRCAAHETGAAGPAARCAVPSARSPAAWTRSHGCATACPCRPATPPAPTDPQRGEVHLVERGRSGYSAGMRRAATLAALAALLMAADCGTDDAPGESSSHAAGSEARTGDITLRNVHIVPAVVPGQCVIQADAPAMLAFAAV